MKAFDILFLFIFVTTFSQENIEYDIYLKFCHIENKMLVTRNYQTDKYESLETYWYKQKIKGDYFLKINHHGKISMTQDYDYIKKINFSHAVTKLELVNRYRKRLDSLYKLKLYTEEGRKIMESGMEHFYRRNKVYKLSIIDFNLKEKNIIDYSIFSKLSENNLNKILRNAQNVYIIDMDNSSKDSLLIKEVRFNYTPRF